MSDSASNFGMMKAHFDTAWSAMRDGLEFMPLWPGEAPYHDANVQQHPPGIAVFPVSGQPRGVVIVCAGGAYLFKNPEEALPVALRLQEAGFGAAILDYRVVPYPQQASTADIQRAIRLLRHRANEWGFMPDKIAVLGFSAGSHLSSQAAACFDAGDPTHADPVERHSSRPDAAVLCYGPAVLPSTQGLIGAVVDRTWSFDIDRHPHDAYPPFFLWQTVADSLVDVRMCLQLSLAMKERNIPFELHLFPEGEHGLGLAQQQPGADQWMQLCVNWLERLGF